MSAADPHSEAGVVIAGGGLAAVRTAQGVRDLGHTGRIVIVSEEAEEPYDRPPLSKEMLLGESSVDPTKLLSADRFSELGIDLVLRQRAAGLNLATRTLQLSGGTAIPYDTLVVATGARARRLDSLDGANGVCYLRTADDARRLHAALRPGAEIVIVGAGFIGLEVASAVLARGGSVHVVEAAPHPLGTVLGERLAGWLQDWHARRGVQFHCGVTVTGFKNADGHATDGQPADRRTRIQLSDSTSLHADAIVVGIGVERELGWLAAAGLAVHTGLVCDDDGRTSDERIFGSGDIACRHADDVACRPVGHWTASTESAGRTARAVLGLPPQPAADEGYFWSNQAALKLQSVGSFPVGAEIDVTSGDLAEGMFVAIASVDGEVRGVLAANSPREFLRARLARRRALQTASTARL